MRTALRIACLLTLLAGPAAGQEILFDQMVEAGGLKCYPVYGDASSWYYLPDQPHVATTGEAARPEFSFLMYTSPEQSGEEGITSAPGGGVAHMLVAYDVPEDMVRRAQSELQRTKPGAQLKGPVAYTDGTFNLVTAVTDPEAGLSRRVVGVGNAPVMSGHKAAVSMHLTPTGAMLLWESFSQRTPDISVNFEMTVSGYRNPVEATMTFNYERIHETTQLQAGIESRYLEADVDVLLGKMVDNGSISIELKGAPPEQWAEVQKLGLELAKHHLFENMGAAPLSQITSLASRPGSSGSNSGSSSQATATPARTPTTPSSSSSTSTTPTPTPARQSRLAPTDGDRARTWSAVPRVEMVALPPPELDPSDRALLERAQQLYRDGRYREALNEIQSVTGLEQSREGRLWAALCHLRLGDRDATVRTLRQFAAMEGVDGRGLEVDIAGIEGSQYYSSSPQDRETRAEVARSLLQTGQNAIMAVVRTPQPTTGAAATAGRGTTPTPAPSSAGASRFRDDEGQDEPSVRARALEDADDPGLRRIRPSDRRGRSGSDSARQADDDPFKVKIAYRMRRIERRGSFSFNMKQWNRVEIPVRFAANIGDLSRYKDDPRMFRRVSLNDPMFKQREIPVTVDVASEEAFAAMLNAVTVTLRKRHQSGRETLDEVTIQRADFASGRPDTLYYGWDGDDDRTAWLDYEHRLRWSYVGGPVIETDWRPTSAGAMVLSPPLRQRELTLEADPVLLREQGVRAVVVQVDYDAAGTPRTAHATLRPTNDVGTQSLVLYQDPQQPNYRYRIDWRLYGGERMDAGPFEDTSDFIFVDEIPR